MNRRTVLTGLSAALTAGPGLAFADPGFGVFEAAATPLRGAPDFTGYKGSPALLIVFEAACPWCRLQLGVAKDLLDTEMTILAVGARGRSRALTEELRQSRALSVPAYRASPGLLKALGDPPGTPITYKIDSSGAVTQFARGLQDEAALWAMWSQA